MEICPAFIDETGILTGPVSNQPFYGVGVLIVPDPSEITDRLYRLHFNLVQDRASQRSKFRKDIRNRGTPPTLAEADRLMWSTRHHEYKFADVTRFNIQQYVDLLNLYFSSPGLEFHSLMMDRRDLRAGLHKWGNDEWGAYVSICRRLLDASLSRDVFAIVDLQGKPHKSDVVLEDVLCSVDRIKGCLRATSDMSIFLQIVDLLLGCVQFDFKDRLGYYDATSRRAKEKRQLVNFVRSRLGIGSNMPLLGSSRSFEQWDTPSLFTVRQGEW